MKNLILNKKEDKVEINIIGHIGSSLFSEGYTREDAKRDIIENRDKELVVNIFSEGGSFYDGVFIYEILKSHPKKVTTNILSMAASAASIIALGGSVVRMSKNATLMVHEPSLYTSLTSTNADETKDVLDKAYNVLLNIYQSKTGMNDDELRKLIDGKDVWLSSDEALEYGFIDEVFETKAVLTNLHKFALDGEIIQNHLKNKLVDQMDLEKYTELENSLEEMNNKYSELSSELESVKNENAALIGEKDDLELSNLALTEEKEGLETEKSELENKVKELEVEKINTFINNAVEDGRITEPQKADYLKLAETDFDSVKNIISSIPVREKVADFISNKNESKLEDLIKGKEKWDEIDFLKKDPETLEKLKNEFPEKYSEIHKKAYPTL